MKFFAFWRRKNGPSEEAIRAHGEATRISAHAEIVYGERHRILEQNHFAERIRIIYEGR